MELERKETKSNVKFRFKMCQFLGGFFVGILLCIVLVDRRIYFNYYPSILVKFIPRDTGDHGDTIATILKGWNRLLTPSTNEGPVSTETQYLRSVKGASGPHGIYITCLVPLLGDERTKTRQWHEIHAAWGKRCNRLLLYKSVNSDLSFNVSTFSEKGFLESTIIYLNTSKHSLLDDRNVLLELQLVKYAINKFPKTDWFLRTDPLTYVIFENLMLFLQDRSIREPVIYGKFGNRDEFTGMESTMFTNNTTLQDMLRCIFTKEDRRLQSSNISINKILDECINTTNITFLEPLDSNSKPLLHMFDSDESVNKFYEKIKHSSAPETHRLTNDCTLPSHFSITFQGEDVSFLQRMEFLLYNNMFQIVQPHN